MAEGAASRDTLVSLADEPQKPIPQSKAAYIQDELGPFDGGVCGGVCGFTAAVADVGVCARARAAVRTGRPGGRRLRAIMFLVSQVLRVRCFGGLANSLRVSDVLGPPGGQLRRDEVGSGDEKRFEAA